MGSDSRHKNAGRQLSAGAVRLGKPRMHVVAAYRASIGSYGKLKKLVG